MKHVKNDIKELMAQMPHTTTIADTVCIRWSRTGVGFGETVFFTDEDGKLMCDNEGMSREFIKEVLIDLLDNAELTHEKLLD